MDKQLEELEAALSAELARDPRAAIQRMRKLQRAIRMARMSNERLLASPALKPLA